MRIKSIYFNMQPDIELNELLAKLADDFGGSYFASDKYSLLKSLALAVEDSDLTIVIGSFCSDNSVVRIVSKGLGLKLSECNGTMPDGEAPMMPESAEVFTDKIRRVGGAVITSGWQKIILLTDDSELRNEIINKDIIPGLFPDFIKADEEDTLIDGEDDCDINDATNIDFDIDKVATVDPNIESIENFRGFDDFDYIEPEKKEDVYHNEVNTQKNKSGAFLRIMLCVFIPILVACAIFAGGWLWYAKIYSADCSDRNVSLMQAEFSALSASSGSFDSLAEKMSNIDGWINVEGTNVNHPFVYSGGSEEGYYKDKLADGSPNTYGTIYCNQWLAKGSQYDNIIISGGNFGDGRMFSDIASEVRENDLVKIISRAGEERYRTIAVFDSIGVNFDYNVDKFASAAEKDKFVSGLALVSNKKSEDVTFTKYVTLIAEEKNRVTVAVCGFVDVE